MNRFLPLVIILVATTAGVAQTPAVHTFTPDRFSTPFSFAHPPALRIKPGDRVVTTKRDRVMASS